jgi:hypothetical protein
MMVDDDVQYPAGERIVQYAVQTDCRQWGTMRDRDGEEFWDRNE